MSFVYGLTIPAINIYFMQLVSLRVFAVANLLSIALDAIVNSTVPIDYIKKFYRDNFEFIIIIDVVCFVIISFLSVEYVNVRFIGFSILSAISSNLWCIIMRDSINNAVSGDELTSWTSFSKSITLYFSLAGSALAIYFTDLDIVFCIGLQCAANIAMGYTDLKAFNMLKSRKEEILNE